MESHGNIDSLNIVDHSNASSVDTYVSKMNEIFIQYFSVQNVLWGIADVYSIKF